MAFQFSPELGYSTLALMLKIRLFEEKIEELFSEHLLHGTTHLAIGQEAVHAGVATALRPDDWIMTTHRCHGHTLARGSSIRSTMAEFFGLAEGLVGGLGGSMHLFDLEHYNAGSSAVVGSSVAIATGMALQLKRLTSKQLVVAFFGDGASSRGVVHESMNIASVLSLPVLFLCEHNQYGMSAAAHEMVSAPSIATRGLAYNLESRSVDGNDVEVVHNAVQEATAYIREEGKPYLLETMTYRLCGHSKSDRLLYRSRAEEQQWKQRDPIELLRQKLEMRGELSDHRYSALAQQISEEIAQEATALFGEHRMLTLSEALSYVYVEGGSQ